MLQDDFSRPDISVDLARENELDRLIEIHLASFPDERGALARQRNFTANPRGSFDRLYVARDRASGTALGHAFLFSLTLGFGGALVPVGGIASVGVAPEARGQGVAARLLAHLHDVSQQKGHALTALYAFRQGFYARHGYAPARSAKHLFLAPSAFLPFVPLKGTRDPFVTAAATHADRAVIEALHARQAARGTGWELRVPAQWDRLFLDERRSIVVVRRNDVTSGYVASSLHQKEPHAKTNLRVHELVADDVASRRALYAHLARQRDQVNEIALAVADDDPLELLLIDADRARQDQASEDLEHPLGTIAGGPMLRLHDPAVALTARGYAEDGEIRLLVGPRRLHLRVASGVGTVSEMAAHETDGDVRMDISTLAAVAFGGWSVRAASSLGAVDGAPSAVERASRLFALPAYFSTDPF